jgi:Family of unknown function (DUF6011)
LEIIVANYAQESITPRQRGYLKHLVTLERVDEVLDVLTKHQASSAIDHILAKNKANGAPVPAASSPTSPSAPLPPKFPPTPPQQPFHGFDWTLPISPEQLKSMIKEGYYAWRADDSHPFIFLRVKVMTYGKNKGNLKISQQHGPDYKDILTVFPSGQGRVWRKDRKETLDAILGVLVSATTSARAYAQEVGKCCICNTALTVDRSRWYGIGPECEKSHQSIIDNVDDEYGFTFEERTSHGY